MSCVPTAVGDGDRVNVYADDLGRLVNQPFVPRDLIVHNTITITSSTSETTLLAAGDTGVFRDIVYLLFSNSSGTQTEVTIKDSTSGTTRLIVSLAASGGGASVALPVQLTQSSAANAWTATCADSVASVYITAIAVEGN